MFELNRSILIVVTSLRTQVSKEFLFRFSLVLRFNKHLIISTKLSLIAITISTRSTILFSISNVKIKIIILRKSIAFYIIKNISLFYYYYILKVRITINISLYNLVLLIRNLLLLIISKSSIIT